MALRLEFKLNWKKLTPQLPLNLSMPKLVTKGQTAGRPTDPDLQSMLNAPAGERANAIGKRAELMTVTGNVPNRTDNKTRFITVPENLWT